MIFNKRALLLLVAATGVGAGACATSFAVPTAVDLDYATRAGKGVTLTQLEEGRGLYLRRCGGCHSLHRVDEFSAEEWPHEVDQMRQKAHLDDSERDRIVAYLSAVSARLREEAVKAAAGDRPPAP